MKETKRQKVNKLQVYNNHNCNFEVMILNN
jgi:hypothetical protein